MMPCAFTILLFATAAAASTVPAQLDAILKDYGRTDAPGASVLVAQDGKVLYRKAFGLANLEERTPNGGSHCRCDPRHAVSRQPGRRRAHD